MFQGVWTLDSDNNKLQFSVTLSPFSHNKSQQMTKEKEGNRSKLDGIKFLCEVICNQWAETFQSCVFCSCEAGICGRSLVRRLTVNSSWNQILRVPAANRQQLWLLLFPQGHFEFIKHSNLKFIQQFCGNLPSWRLQRAGSAQEECWMDPMIIENNPLRSFQSFTKPTFFYNLVLYWRSILTSPQLHLSNNWNVCLGSTFPTSQVFSACLSSKNVCKRGRADCEQPERWNPGHRALRVPAAPHAAAHQDGCWTSQHFISKSARIIYMKQRSEPTNIKPATEWRREWRDHLSLAGTQSEDPVAVELVQSDRLVEAALVDPNSSAVTWRGNTARLRKLREHWYNPEIHPEIQLFFSFVHV